MSVVFGELDETGTLIDVTCTGDDRDRSQCASVLTSLTPAFNPTPDPNVIAVPLSWAAVTQLSHGFPGGLTYDGHEALRWVPGPRLSQWLIAEIIRRSCDGDFTGQPPALEPMKHQTAAGVAIGMNGRFLLADDMGAGKTLSYLMGLAELEARNRNPWPALFITPAGVVDTVLEEVPRFYPHWKAAAYRGASRQKYLRSNAQLLVMGYETMRNDTGLHSKPGPLLKLKAGAVVYDECHGLANFGSLQSRQARRLARHIPNVIAGSGTPITKNVAGFWPVLNSMYPDSYPSRERYKSHYCLSRGRSAYGNGDAEITGIDPAREPEFRVAMQGVFRRVAKQDVLDLPPKTYSTRHVEIPAAWRAAYDQMEADMLAELPDQMTPLEANTAIVKMTRLRQLACSACDVETWRELEDNPRSPNFGQDVQRTKVTLKEPCFPAGTPVLTARGMVPIENVVVGDLVLTHKARWRKVTHITGRRSEVISNGWMSVTANHLFYARKKSPVVRRGLPFALDDPEWVRADQMRNLFTAVPVQAEELPIPAVAGESVDTKASAFWYMVGRWLGDGWLRHEQKSRLPHQVVICCGKHERGELKTRLAATGILWRQSENATTFVFTATHPGLNVWLRANFGEHANKKTLPGWIFGAAQGIRRSVLDGYLAADGHYAVKRNRWQINTVSRSLAVSLRVLAATLGYTTSIYVSRFSKETQVIKGHTVGKKTAWRLELHENNGWYTRTDERHQWVKQRKPLLPTTEEKVFDLTVEEDHSFVAHGFVVHNCWKGTELVEILRELHEGEGEHDERGAQHGHTVGSRPVIAFAESAQLVRVSGLMAEKRGYAVGYIDGSVSHADRTQVRLAFQAGQLDLLCVTTGTGGTGLNLTAADTVIFLARPWGYVPAVQAEDRAYRRGQTKPVQVIDIVTKHSVESRVRAALREKAGNLADLVQDRRIVEGFLGGRSQRELGELVADGQ